MCTELLPIQTGSENNLSAKGIEDVTCRQIASDHYRLLITLTHPHWGYDIDYAGTTMRIKIRRPPVLAARDSVFAGLSIAVDAGHGGESHGAIGATGRSGKRYYYCHRHAGLGAALAFERSDDSDDTHGD